MVPVPVTPVFFFSTWALVLFLQVSGGNKNESTGREIVTAAGSFDLSVDHDVNAAGSPLDQPLNEEPRQGFVPPVGNLQWQWLLQQDDEQRV